MAATVVPVKSTLALTEYAGLTVLPGPGGGGDGGGEGFGVAPFSHVAVLPSYTRNSWCVLDAAAAPTNEANTAPRIMCSGETCINSYGRHISRAATLCTMENIVAKSGGGDDASLEDAFADAAHKLMTPCFEAAALVAAEYAKACGRDVIMARDFECGLRFAARHVLGKQTETFFPEDAEEDESDAESIMSVEDEDGSWTRYDGDDERLRLVNEAVDTWSEWVPETPLEAALKRSIDASLLD